MLGSSQHSSRFFFNSPWMYLSSIAANRSAVEMISIRRLGPTMALKNFVLSKAYPIFESASQEDNFGLSFSIRDTFTLLIESSLRVLNIMALHISRYLLTAAAMIPHVISSVSILQPTPPSKDNRFFVLSVLDLICAFARFIICAPFS